MEPHQLTSPKPRLRDSCNTQKKKECSAGRSMKSKIQIREVTIAPISWHPSLIKRWRLAKVAVLNSIKLVLIPFCTLATLAGKHLRNSFHNRMLNEMELSYAPDSRSDRTGKRCTIKAFPRETQRSNPKPSCSNQAKWGEPSLDLFLKAMSQTQNQKHHMEHDFQILNRHLLPRLLKAIWRMIWLHYH